MTFEQSMRIGPRRFAPALALAALWAWPASAATFCVPSGNAAALQSTLQTAQANGVDDVIRIEQGTYTAPSAGAFIHAANNSLTIEGGYTAGCGSRVVNAANTIIDGGNGALGTNAQALRLYSEAPVTYIVDGITVRNGRAMNTSDPNFMNGAGLWVPVTNAKVVVMRSAFTGNQTFQDGGGIYVVGASSVSISSSTISNNNAGFGAGIYVLNAKKIEITNNTISSNTVLFTPDGRGDGGGIYIDTSFPLGGTTAATFSVIRINGNTINSNTAAKTGGGVFIFGDEDTSTSANVELFNNAFGANTAETGGGFGSSLLSNLRMLSNTFSNNQSTTNGAGITLFGVNDVTIASNLLHSNTAQGSGNGGGSIASTPSRAHRRTS